MHTHCRYAQIKQMSLNGIRYSFIKDAKLKAKIQRQVAKAFIKFEADFPSTKARVEKALAKEADVEAARSALAEIKSLTIPKL